MKAIALIFSREVRVRLRDWRFWVGVFSLPLLIGLVSTVVFLLERSQPMLRLYVFDPSQRLNLSPTESFLFVPAPSTAEKQLDSLLTDDSGILIYRGDSGDIALLELHLREALGKERLEKLERLLRDALIEVRLREAGISPYLWQQIQRPPQVITFLHTERGKPPKPARGALFLREVLGFLLFLLIMNAGGQILLSVLEEKTNRLAEYMLIFVSPAHLLTGKILASLFLTLFQASIWAGLAIGGLVFMPTGSFPIRQAAEALPWEWLIPYAAGGVVLYIFLYAAAGASSDSITELSSFAQALQWPLLLSFLIVNIASLQPTDTFMIFLSHFPLTSALAMPLRIVSGEVPVWEKVLSIVLLWGSVYAAQRLSALLYRRGLLLYGQRLSWREIWQILRT